MPQEGEQALGAVPWVVALQESRRSRAGPGEPVPALGGQGVRGAFPPLVLTPNYCYQSFDWGLLWAV